MTRNELDSLTVYRSDDGAGVELWNSSGLVDTFEDRDQAYAEIRRLRGVTSHSSALEAAGRVARLSRKLADRSRPDIGTEGERYRARVAAGADIAEGSEILAARVLAAVAHVR